MRELSSLVVYPCLSWADHCAKLQKNCGTWGTVVAGYCIGLGGTATVEDRESSDLEVAESLGALAVETCRTHRSKPPRNLDHNHIDPVGVSMSEIVQIGLWKGIYQKGLELHSCSEEGVDPILNAAV